MRISDWSSDVCSSDLCDDYALVGGQVDARDTCHVILSPAPQGRWQTGPISKRLFSNAKKRTTNTLAALRRPVRLSEWGAGTESRAECQAIRPILRRVEGRRRSGTGECQERTEEHTSELQSLMR